MNRIEALNLLDLNEKSTTMEIERTYKKKATLLRSQIVNSPSDEMTEKYETALEELEEVYVTCLGIPGVQPPEEKKKLKRKEKKEERKKGTSVENSKKPSFLTSLMHKGVFFLVLSSLTAAILLLIMWLGSRGNVDQMESMQNILRNKPLVIENSGERPFKIQAMKVFYYDKNSTSIKSFEKADLNREFIEPDKQSELLKFDDDNVVLFEGEALFFTFICSNGKSVISYTDYVGDHKVDDSYIKLDLDKYFQ